MLKACLEGRGHLHSQPKIAQMCLSPTIDHHIRALHIPVQKVVTMHVIKGKAKLPENRNNLILVKMYPHAYKPKKIVLIIIEDQHK